MRILTRLLVLLSCYVMLTLPANAQNPVVSVETSMGSFSVELYPEKAPVTVANFLSYVDEGFYSGTLFHRVIAYFMIQGGGVDQSLKNKKTRDPIPSEADNGLTNLRGTIAMARTRDINSANSQFFINVEDNNHLDKSEISAGYTVFGKVVAGMDVVDEISNVETDNINGSYDLPIEPVIIYAIGRTKN